MLCRLYFLMLKRVFDVVMAAFLLPIFLLPLLIVAVLVKTSSPGPILYWSDRVGRKNQIFKMPKFRSMQIGSPTIATHLLINPDQYLTSIGSFLRKSSLDELPQLWCIFNGDMSFVGPRPALFNQVDLIDERTKLGIHILRPGITGWAQVNGRDELSISKKVVFDFEYLQRRSFFFDMLIIILTIMRVLSREDVSH